MEITKPKKRWFFPLRKAPKRKQILAFDVEGSGVQDGFVCGAIAGEFINEFHTSRESMWESVLGYGADGFMLWAHNTQYDLPILEGGTFPSGDMLFTASNLLWSKYIHWGRKVSIYDSGNLFPRHSVAALGGFVNLPKLELNPRLLQQLADARPWRHFTEAEQKEIREYNLLDAEIVYQAVSELQEMILDLGGELRATIASCAMDIYRRAYHRFPWLSIGPATNKIVRSGYYGGRTEAFVFGEVQGVNMYDVTSLYPYAQQEANFPHPNSLTIDLLPDKTSQWLKKEGICSVTVQVPESFIPPLPYRFNKRLFFPYGRMRGEWTISEVRHALELGVALLGCDWVISSSKTFNPFGRYIDDLFSLRSVYLANADRAANLIKLLLNSLYGKWGLNPDRGLYRLVSLEQVDDFENMEGYISQEINGRLFAYGPIKSDRQPDYVNVFIAAQISAGARLILLDTLLDQGVQSCYCDTDSIITQGRIPEGDGLGDWRLQMENGSAELLGPKAYALHNAAMESVYHAKGVPQRLAREYLETGAARYLRALPIREAIAQNTRPATWVETIKTTEAIMPKRAPNDEDERAGRAGITTRPYAVGELQHVYSRWIGSPDDDYPDQARLIPQLRKLRQLSLGGALE